jgi:hypothetical protein
MFTCAIVASMLVAMMMAVVGQVNCDNMAPVFERCDNTTATVKSFYTNACPIGASLVAPCLMKHGQHVVFDIFFESGKLGDFR